jgi:hypothetical protein
VTTLVEQSAIIDNKHTATQSSNLEASSEFPQEGERLTSVISQAVGFLLRMVAVARKPAVSYRFNVLLQQYDLDKKQEESIGKMYPKLSTSALRRLGLAMAERKELIASNRREKEQHVKQAMSNEATKASLRDPDHAEHRFGSAPSIYTHGSSSTPSSISPDFPSLRTLSPNLTPFSCPICYSEQSFKNESAWR